MLNSIQDAVRLLLPARKKTNATSGWISFNAPCCPHNGESADTRGRGGIVTNPDGGVSYHCFNCGYKASFIPGRHLTYKFRKLLGWLGSDENTIKRLTIDAIRIRELVAPEQKIEAEALEPIDFKARPLPEESKTFHELSMFYDLGERELPSELSNAIYYVAHRHIDLSRYEFMWTPETAYNLHKRVIVPFTWHGKVIGYTARAVDPEVKPKYHSSYEPNYVFNVDQQRRDARFVIVCEGPFDAMAIDGVAVLSNECSETQADIIDSLGREVIVVPDFDIELDTRSNRRRWSGSTLVDRAIDYGWTVSFPVWNKDYKDISEAVSSLGKLFVVKSILESRQTSRLKIELHKKRIYN